MAMQTTTVHHPPPPPIPHRRVPVDLGKQANLKTGNWLGGEAVYNSIRIPGHPSIPGYVNISTSDLLVHGQAKQSGSFAFVRVYDSGHEVPAYQPLTALAIFERAISGYDIATGQSSVDRAFVTVGPAQSSFREGNASVLFALVEGGREMIVNASTYDAVVAGESAPARHLLAELQAAVGGLGGGKLGVGNATASGGGGVDGLRGVGKGREPIHLRRRGGMVRGGGMGRHDVGGIEGDGFVRRRGLRDLGV